MRQAGMLAAAGLHALDHHVARLADDHRRAERLAAGLGGLAGVTVVAQHSNMVFIDVPAARLGELRQQMEAASIRLSIGYTPRVRLVTHLDVDDEDVDRVVAAFRAFAASA